MFLKIFESEPPRYYLPDETGGIPTGTGFSSLYNPYLVTPPRIYAESIYGGASSIIAVFVKKERTPFSDFTLYVMAIGDYIHYPGYNYTVFRLDGVTGAYLDRSAPASLPPGAGSLFHYQIFQARDGGLWRQSVLGDFFEIDTLNYLPIAGTDQLPAKYAAVTVDLPMVDRSQNLVVMKSNNEGVNQIGVYNFTTGALVRRITISGLPVQIFPEDNRRCYVVSETFLISPVGQILNLVDYSTGEVISTLRAPALEAGARSYTYAWDRFLRRILVFTQRADDTDGACLSTISGYYPVPLSVGMTSPIPLKAPRANRRTPFLCKVYGDAGEAITGIKVTPVTGTSAIVGAPPFTDSDGEAIITLIPDAAGTDTLIVTSEVNA